MGMEPGMHMGPGMGMGMGEHMMMQCTDPALDMYTDSLKMGAHEVDMRAIVVFDVNDSTSVSMGDRGFAATYRDIRRLLALVVQETEGTSCRVADTIYDTLIVSCADLNDVGPLVVKANRAGQAWVQDVTDKLDDGFNRVTGEMLSQYLPGTFSTGVGFGPVTEVGEEGCELAGVFGEQAQKAENLEKFEAADGQTLYTREIYQAMADANGPAPRGVFTEVRTSEGSAWSVDTVALGRSMGI
jgi:hypothetical protein